MEQENKETQEKQPDNAPEKVSKPENKTQKPATKPEPKKDWFDYVGDFIKNPITTGLTGLTAGYLIGANKANKEVEELKTEHKKEIAKRDEQFGMLMEQMQLMNKHLASSLKGLPPAPEERKRLELEEDPEKKVYRYIPKKHKQFKLK
ncbi:MAG: hypothetical protein ACHQRM_18165 [Bacteroidia bacterium]